MAAEDRLQSLVEKAKEAISAVHHYGDVPLRSTHSALSELADHVGEARHVVGEDLDNAGEAD